MVDWEEVEEKLKKGLCSPAFIVLTAVLQGWWGPVARTVLVP